MDLSSPSIDRSFSIDRTPSIERTASLDSRSILSVLENSNLPYTEKYNRITRALRSALLRYNPDIRNQKELIRSIFRRIDENDSGTLTSDEMLAFISSPELGLFETNDQNAAKFCDLIVEQIDVNRDGTISFQELQDFLFPSKPSSSETPEHEIGIVLELTRKALIRLVSQAAAQGDEGILTEFGNLSKMNVKKGKNLDSRIAKKSLNNLVIPEFKRSLNETEIEWIMKTLDINGDGVISAKEFKSWLFPSTGKEDKLALVNLFKSFLEDKFRGDLRELYNTFKSYGADCIYKADFITHIKALDSTIPRQMLLDLVGLIYGNEKGVGFSKLADFLGYSASPRKIDRLDSLDSSGTLDRIDSFLTDSPQHERSLKLSTIDSNKTENEIISPRESLVNIDNHPELETENIPQSSINVPIEKGSLDPLTEINQEPPVHETTEEIKTVPELKKPQLMSSDSNDGNQISEPNDNLQEESANNNVSNEETLIAEFLSKRNPSDDQKSVDINSNNGVSDQANQKSFSTISRQPSGRVSIEKQISNSQPIIKPKSPEGPTKEELFEVRRMLMEQRSERFNFSPPKPSPLLRSPALRNVTVDFGVSEYAKQKEDIAIQLETLRLSEVLDGNEELSPPPPPPLLSETLEPLPRSPINLEEMGVLSQNGAVGFTPLELAEFGYVKHTGKWRGFPFDSWSCCNTAFYVCPVAQQKLKKDHSGFLSSNKVFSSSVNTNPELSDEDIVLSGPKKFKILPKKKSVESIGESIDIEEEIDIPSKTFKIVKKQDKPISQSKETYVVSLSNDQIPSLMEERQRRKKSTSDSKNLTKKSIEIQPTLLLNEQSPSTSSSNRNTKPHVSRLTSNNNAVNEEKVKELVQKSTSAVATHYEKALTNLRQELRQEKEKIQKVNEETILNIKQIQHQKMDKMKSDLLKQFDTWKKGFETKILQQKRSHSAPPKVYVQIQDPNLKPKIISNPEHRRTTSNQRSVSPGHKPWKPSSKFARIKPIKQKTANISSTKPIRSSSPVAEILANLKYENIFPKKKIAKPWIPNSDNSNGKYNSISRDSIKKEKLLMKKMKSKSPHRSNSPTQAKRSFSISKPKENHYQVPSQSPKAPILSFSPSNFPLDEDPFDSPTDLAKKLSIPKSEISPYHPNASPVFDYIPPKNLKSKSISRQFYLEDQQANYLSLDENDWNIDNYSQVPLDPEPIENKAKPNSFNTQKEIINEIPTNNLPTSVEFEDDAHWFQRIMQEKQRRENEAYIQAMK